MNHALTITETKNQPAPFLLNGINGFPQSSVVAGRYKEPTDVVTWLAVFDLLGQTPQRSIITRDSLFAHAPVRDFSKTVLSLLDTLQHTDVGETEEEFERQKFAQLSESTRSGIETVFASFSR